mmetsp:Transcript_52219/g.138371  ORF Transcript_52219/g.138371 Transcript_52219/m.138371 type:complete len:102 (+) Transcript_52219:1153-1458(+)
MVFAFWCMPEMLTTFAISWATKKWTMAMKWRGSDKYRRAQDRAIRSEGRVARRVREGGGLTFTQVLQAGHMVPLDQPAVSLDMLNEFVHVADTVNLVDVLI